MSGNLVSTHRFPLLEYILEQGGLATFSSIQLAMREQGVFAWRSDEEKIDDWERWQVGQAVSRLKAGNGAKYPAVLVTGDGDGDKLAVAVNEQTAEMRPDLIKDLLKTEELKRRAKSITAKSASYMMRDAQQVLFDDFVPEVEPSPLSDSHPANELWQYLEPMGLGLVQEYQAGQYRADFAQPEKRILIEVDSYEYHFKTKKIYQDHAIKDHYYLEKHVVNGWELIHLHACQIMFDAEKIANQVKRIVLNR